MSAKQQTIDWGGWAWDKFGIPFVSAVFAVGMMWSAFARVQHDVADLEVSQDQHEVLAGHPIVVERWEVLEARQDATEQGDKDRDKRVIAICIATGAACEF